MLESCGTITAPFRCLTTRKMFFMLSHCFCRSVSFTAAASGFNSLLKDLRFLNCWWLNSWSDCCSAHEQNRTLKPQTFTCRWTTSNHDTTPPFSHPLLWLHLTVISRVFCIVCRSIFEHYYYDYYIVITQHWAPAVRLFVTIILQL